MKVSVCRAARAALGVFALFTGGFASAQQIVYVNQAAPLTSTQDGTSWANAYRELRDALASPALNPSATNPVEVWVATGTYLPTTGTNRFATFRMKSYMVIVGGFSGNEASEGARPNPILPTVLSGDIGQPEARPITQRTQNYLSIPVDYSDPGLADNCYNVITCVGVSNSGLDSLVVTGGFAFRDESDTNLTQLDIEGMITPVYVDPSATTNVFGGQAMVPPTNTIIGGGLYLVGSHGRPATETTLGILNCIFVNNAAEAFGGGAGITEGSVQLFNTQFLGNEAGREGGAYWGLNSNPDAENCYFTGNSAVEWGGAVICRMMPSALTTIDNSSAGGPSLADSVNAEMSAMSTAKDLCEFNEGETIFQKLGRFFNFPVEPAQLTRPPGVWSALASGLKNGNGFTGRISAGLRSAAAAAQTADRATLAMDAMDGLSGAYDVVSDLISVGDMSYQLAALFGADTNSAAARGFETFVNGFNLYATPTGWAELIVGALVHEEPSFDEQAKLIKEQELEYYNQLNYDNFIDCTFSQNIASDGGGLCVAFQNLHMEGCYFTDNLAENGAGVFSSAYDTPELISCVFDGNHATLGHSALENISHSRAQIANCTFINNGSDPTNGFAVGVETGSEIKIANSILWGNTNSDPANALGGADLFVATRALLSTNSLVSDETTNTAATYTNAQQAYDAAGPAFGDWIGICELTHSDVQSLGRLPVGTDKFLLFDDLVDNPDLDEQIDEIEANFAMANEDGTLEEYSFVNTGEGIRPGFLTNANISIDPKLDVQYTPAANSAVVDAGSDARLNNGVLNSDTDLDFQDNPRIEGASIDMGAVEFQGYGAGMGVVYVNQAATGDGSGRDWDDAMTNLQDALNLTNAQIWVAVGTYYPTSGTNRAASFYLTNGDQVLGGFRGGETSASQRDYVNFPATLSGNIGNPNIDSDNSETVVVCQGTTNTLLDGFIITKGRGTYGAGLSGQDATIQNCQFIDNAAAIEGGGVNGQYLVLRNCSFINNSAAVGGGISGSELTVSGCSFIGNSSGQGGGAYIGGTGAAFYSCLFASNSVAGVDARGGALYSDGSALNLYNETFAYNNALGNNGPASGGGIDIENGGRLTAENCIFWDNQVASQGGQAPTVEQQQIEVGPSAGIATLSYNLIDGLAAYASAGVSNFTADPAFQAPLSGNYQLRAYSPAIDVGNNNAGPNAPLTDLAALPRIADRIIDLGAYEFQDTPTPLSAQLKMTYTCDGQGNVYVLQLLTNAILSGYSWLINRNDGLGFVALTDDAIHSGSQTAVLTITHPLLTMAGWQYVLRSGDFESAPFTLRVSGTVVYVKQDAAGADNGSDWADAYTSLPAALAAATPCSQIWVAAGTYYPTSIGSGDRTAAFQLAQGVAVYGGFNGTETALSQRNWFTNVSLLSGCIATAGRFDPLNDSLHLLINDGSNPGAPIDATAILDGFTLFGATEGSVLNEDANPTFVNCAFIENQTAASAILQSGPGAASAYSHSIFAQVPLYACGEGVAEYAVTNTDGPMTGAVWQVNNEGEGYTTIANGGDFTLSTNANGLTLAVANATGNGAQYRFALPLLGYASPGAQFILTPPAIYYVNTAVSGGAGDGSSWANAFHDLGAALTNAAGCAQIWVARGTYSAAAVGGVFVMKSGVAVYGGFAGTETSVSQRNVAANPTFLTQVSNNPVVLNDSAQSFVTLDGSAVLDGFVFSNIVKSAAIENISASPTIRNCLFTGNGFYSIWNLNSQPAIAGCVFSNNLAIAVVNHNSPAQMVSNIFTGQNLPGGSGAALVNQSSDALVQNCWFYGNSANYGAAIDNEGTSSPQILDSIFARNSAGNGGAIFDESSARLMVRNCLFFENVCASFRGGAIADLGAGPMLINCTFADNQAAFSGAGFYSEAPTNFVENCIFWNNRLSTYLYASVEAAQIDAPASGLVLTHSVVQGLSTLIGPNNLSYDPLFAGASTNNYRLGYYSPAINAGLTTGLDATDLDGNPRVAGASEDIGAYELQGSALGVVDLQATPSDASVCAASAASFTAAGPAGSNYSFFWYTNTAGGNFFPAGGQFTITTSGGTSVLSIPSTTLAQDNMGVEVQIGGFVSAPALLSVAPPTVIYVSRSATGAGDGSSWNNAYTNFAAALSAAGSCAQIWVAAGTYPVVDAQGNPAALQMRSGVGIYGGFAGTETSLGQRNWTNHSATLVGQANVYLFDNDGAAVPADNTAVLDGLTLTSAGNGVMRNYTVSPTIRNCTFINSASTAVENVGGSQPIFAGDQFLNNTNGALLNENCSVLVTNCIFQNNRNPHEPGGAIASSSSTFSIIDSRFAGNSSVESGAVDSRDDTVLIARCVFTNNSASIAGALSVLNGSGQIADSLFASNTAPTVAGAADLAESSVTLRNCTIAQNAASGGDAGGVLVESGHATIVNCILWNNVNGAQPANTESAQLRTGPGTTAVSYSCITGLSQYAGSQNTANDPLFQNPMAGNFMLTIYSPSVNAGNTAAIGGDPLDLSRQPRVFGGVVDQGAYELNTPGQTAVGILAEPLSATVCPGQSASFTVTTANYPGNAIEWAQNSGSGFVTVQNDASHQIIANGNSSTLVVENIAASMNGWTYEYSAPTETPFTSSAVALSVRPPQIVYVNSGATGAQTGQDWADAYRDLGAALTEAGNCSQIWVARGTYTPVTGSDGRTSFALSAGAQLYGGFAGTETSLGQRNWGANLTILLGTANDSTIHCAQSGVDRFTTIDGFTITGGAGQIGLDNSLAGPTVRHCMFTGNSGYAVNNVLTSNALFDGCVFSNNTAPALIASRSSYQATNCLFVMNSAGAIYNDACVAAISNSVFTANAAPDSSGGAVLDLLSTNQMVYCIFDGDQAAAGGAVAGEGSTQSILNCLFYGNSASSGGAVYNNSSTQTVINCTIANNAADYGGGINQNFGADTVVNSILWGNTDKYDSGLSAQQFYQGSGAQTILACDIQGWPTTLPDANRDFGLDPIFNNPAQGNYTLQGYSPDIGGGLAPYAAGLPVDLAGQPRTVNNSLDLGAYTALENFGAVDLVQQPLSQTVCPGASVMFSLTGVASGWEYFNAVSSNWVTLPNPPAANPPFAYAITATNATLYLEIQDVSSNLNGLQIRPDYAPYSGYLGAPAVLTVAPPSVIYVNAAAPGGDGSSWASAYNSVATAMAAAGFCHPEIWVARGTYAVPPGGLVVPTDVSLYGGFAGNETTRSQRDWSRNPTILDAGGASADIVNFNAGVDTNTVFDGFIAQNANGAGFYAFQSSPIIRNCVAQHLNGAGLAAVSGSPQIVNCRFLSNTVSSLPAVVSLYSSSATMTRCVVSGNIGEGVESDDLGGASPIPAPGLQSCLITGNTGNGISLTGARSQGTIDNCTISGNYGGGVVLDLGDFNLLNSALWHNGGAIAGASVARNQLWIIHAFVYYDNSSAEQYDPYTQLAADGFTSSVVYNNDDELDPAFVSPILPQDAPTTGGDFHLQACSPVINTGDNGFVPGGALDLAGAPRIQDGAVDRGAYEFSGTNFSPRVLVSLQPAPLMYCALSSNQFSVTASNAAAFQWQVDSGAGFVSLSDNVNYSGSATPVLTILNASGAMNGDKFRCLIANSAGCTVDSDFATLSVPLSSQWYVNAAAAPGGDGLTWQTAFNSVQAALADPNISGCSSEIWVAAGTYSGAISLRNDVSLLGGFNGTETSSDQRNWETKATILTGGSPEVVANNNDSTAVLDGFIVQGATVGASVAGGSPQLLNDVFRDDGQGVNISGGSASLQDCVFTNNGGVSAQGAGLAVSQGAITLQRCVFSGNSAAAGAGLYASGQSAVSVANSLFSGNAASSLGAAIYAAADGSSVALDNCTVTGNRATSSSGGGSVIANNSVFWNNSGPIFGNVNFNNSWQSDPSFANPITAAAAPTVAGDFHPVVCSPLINAGNNGLAVGALDLDGHPRVVDGTVDLGAYEFQQISLHVSIAPAAAVGSFGFPTQFAALANQTNAGMTYQWMGSLNGAAFAPVQNGVVYSGATNAVLMISNAPPALNGSQYYCVVQSGACLVSSPVATYSNVVTQPGAFALAAKGGGSQVTFRLPAPALAGTLGDLSVVVNPMQTGRTRLSNGGLLGLAVTNSTVTVTTAHPFKPGEPVEITADKRLQITNGFGIQPYVWSFLAPVTSSTNRALLATGYPMPTGADVALGDVNHDGSVDMVTATASGVQVWTNNSRGRFVDSGQRLGPGCVALALADVNGDGSLDLVTVLTNGVLRVALNNGAGLFTDSGQNLGSNLTTLTVGDVNGDGALDIVAAGPSAVSVFLNNSEGVFIASGASLSNTACASLALADADGDGALDLIAANGASHPSKVWLNDGLGDFFDSGQALGAGDARKVLAADLNGDGFPDLIIANDDSPSTVWTNNGLGQFAQFLSRENALHPGDAVQSLFGGANTANLVDGNLSTYYSINSSSDEITVTPSTEPTVVSSITLTSSTNFGTAPGIVGLTGTEPNGTSVLLFGQQDISFPALGGSVTINFSNTVALSNYSLILDNTMGGHTELAEIQLWRHDIPVLGGPAVSVALADVDGNGAQDVILARADGSREIWLNDGADNFTRDSRQLGVGSVGPLAVADVDGDGDLDVLQAAGTVGSNSVALLQLADARGNAAASIPLPGAAFSTRFAALGSLATVKVTSLPSHGSLLLNSAAVTVNQQIAAASLANLAYLSQAGFDGMDSFSWQGSSGAGFATNVFPIYVLVQNVPGGPIAVDDYMIVALGGTARVLTNGAVSVLANDTDSSDLPLTGAEVITGPAHGVVAFNDDGTFTYTHDGGESVGDSFVYRVWDSSGLSSSATMHIMVTNVPVPVANNQSITHAEDAPFQILLTGSDPNGHSLTYSVLQPPAHGTLAGAPPYVTYTPTLYYTGSDSFTFVVNDGLLDSAAGSVSITLTHINHPPVANNQTITNAEDGPMPVTLSATDVDGDALTYSVLTQPVHGVLSGTPPQLTYAPTIYYVGSDSFTFRANDGHTNSATGTVTIVLTNINHAPVAIAQSLTRSEDAPFNIVLSATDVDGNPLTYRVVTPPAHGVLSGAAPNLSYTPTLYYVGSDAFTFVANDGMVDSVAQTVAITLTHINHAPVTSNQSLTIPENTPAPITLLGSDLDGNSVSFSILHAPAHGIVTGSSSNRVYTPNANFLGTDSFVYTAQDNQGDTNTGTISLAVMNFNLTVSNTLDAGPGSLRAAVAAANAIPSSFPWNIGFLPALAGQTVALSNTAPDSVGSSALVVSNNISISGQGASGLSISRNTNSAYMRLFHVLPGASLSVNHLSLSGGIAFGQSGASDYAGGGGGAGLGGAIYNEGQLTISNSTVTDNFVAGGPGGSANSAQVGGEGGGVGGGVGGAFFGDFGRPGAFGAGGGGAGPANGVGLGGSGGFGGGNGGGASAGFGNGGAGGFGGGGGGGSASAGGGGLGAGGAIFNNGGSVLIGNSAINANSAAAGSAPANSAAQPGQAFGNAIFNRSGAVTVYNSTFTNNVGDSVGVIYNLGDAGSASVSLEGVVFSAGLETNVVDNTINGGSAFSEPPLQLSASVFRGQSIVIPVLSAGSSNTITAATAGRFGAASFTATNLTYHETGAVVSSDTFQYTVTGPHGLNSLGAVTLAIIYTNHPPVALNESFTVYGDLATLLPLLANDYDPDGDSFMLTSTTTPAHGVITRQGTNVFYQATNPAATNDSFNYTITDSQGAASTGAVSITIAPPVLAVTNIADSGAGSLRAALDLINSGPTALTWSVNLSASLAAKTIKLQTSEYPDVSGDSAFPIAAPITIDGRAAPGVVLARDSAAPPMRFFWIEGNGSLTLQNLALSNGMAAGASGNAGYGGAIYCGGFCTVSNVHFTKNVAQGASGEPGFGGAIANFEGPQLSVANCLLEANTAVAGAGGAIANFDSDAAIQSSVLISNSAPQGDEILNLSEGGFSFVEVTGSTVRNPGGATNLVMEAQAGGQVYFISRSNIIGTANCPLFTDIPDQSQSGPFSLNVAYSLPPGFSSQYQLIAMSENQNFLTNSDLAFSGAGSSRMLTVTPPANDLGAGGVDVIITDGTTYVGTFFVLTLTTPPPVIVPPTIPPSTIAFLNQTLQFQLAGSSNYSLEVQGSTNLFNWSSLKIFPATNAAVLFIDSNADAFSRRFYRLHVLMPP